MKRSNFALRLQPSLLEELRKAAESEGVALNQFINVAVAEKLSAWRTEQFFRYWANRANRAKTLAILERADNPPVPGDELPEDLKRVEKKARRVPVRDRRRSSRK